MSKYINYFYIFSKLTTSIVLILIIIILGYSLIKSYQGIDETSIQLNMKIDSLLSKNNNNEMVVENLIKKIDGTESEIKEIKSLLKESMKSNIGAKQSEQIKDVIKSLTFLQKEFKDFSAGYSIKKNDNNSSDTINSSNKLKKQAENILEFALIKYGQGEDVEREISILENLIPKNKKIIFEKLNLISTKKFYGKENLNNEFNLSLEKFIQSNFLKGSQKPILSFLYKIIKVRPNNLNIYENNEINILMEAKNLMEKQNFQESVNLILTIDSEKKFFYNWFEQVLIYIEFSSTIKKVL